MVASDEEHNRKGTPGKGARQLCGQPELVRQAQEWLSLSREADYDDPAAYEADLRWANNILLERKATMELTPEEMALVERHRKAKAEAERLQALWKDRFSELMNIHDEIEDDSEGWNNAARQFVEYSASSQWSGDELDSFIEALLTATGYRLANIRAHGLVWKRED